MRLDPASVLGRRGLASRLGAWCVLILLGGVATTSSHVPAEDQTVSDLPLLEHEHVVYLGSFEVPTSDGSGRPARDGELAWGGFALGLGPDGKSLYFGCHPWRDMLARVTIPDLGETARVVEPCTPIPNLAPLDALGGTLWWQGRLVLAAHLYYDAGGTTTVSHFTGDSIATLEGPVALKGAPAGWLGGYMGVVPEEWRAALGGPAFTGLCCVSIISRSSYGPTLSIFDPARLSGRAPTAKLVLGYPGDHPLAKWDEASQLFNATTSIGGVAFPAGTRSVLFIGRQGTGPFCYGSECSDPAGKGQAPHAYPYRYQIWAYDASDLARVADGAKASWDVRPYAIWPLSSFSTESSSIRSATYDPATRRLYVVGFSGDTPLLVHVFELARPARG